MNLHYSAPGKVKIEMVDYVKKMVEDFPHQKKLGTNEIQTLVAKHLFQTRETTDDKMMADCHKKPLQGKKFYEFRKMIMNLG